MSKFDHYNARLVIEDDDVDEENAWFHKGDMAKKSTSPKDFKNLRSLRITEFQVFFS